MLLRRKTDQFYAKLRAELKRFLPGERFFTVRSLVADFGVSYRVVMATIARLEQEGLLERRDRSGLYVKAASHECFVAYFYIDWPSGHPRRLAENFAAALQELGDYPVTILPYNYQQDLIPQLESCPADVIVAEWPSRSIRRDELVRLAQFPRTLIVCDHDLRDFSLHSFGSNRSSDALLALRSFHRNGHRRIGLLLAEPPVGRPRTIYEAFLDFAPLCDCEAIPIECHTETGNFSPEQAYQALNQHLEQFGLNFTALLIISGTAGAGVLRAFREYAIPVPQAVSIIAVGNSAETARFHPPLTTIDIDECKAARVKAAALLRYLRNPASGPIYTHIPGEIIWRNSVLNLNPKENDKA